MKRKYTIITAILIMIIDQLAKLLISSHLRLDEVKYIVGNFFYIANAHNTGAAFSILESHTYLIVIISLIVIALFYMMTKDYPYNKKYDIIFGLIYGGIIGNLIDRIVFGYVRDFIGVKIFNYYFPIFNIADSSIVIGIILLILVMVGERYASKK